MRGEAGSQPLPVEAWATRLLTQSRLIVVSFVVAATIWRTGVAEYWQPLQYEITEKFPTPTEAYIGGAVLSPALMTVLGLDDGTERGWYAIHLLLTVAIVAGIGALLWRRFADDDQRVFALVAVAASSLPVIALIRIGHYDVWFLLGAALVALTRSSAVAVLGGIVLGLTNPEQAGVALVTMAAVGLLIDRSALRLVGGAAVGVLMAWVAVRLWYSVNDVTPDGRAGMLEENLGAAWRGFVIGLPIQVFAWFSASWILVLSVCRRFSVFGALVALPALMTVVTLDGTRVFVACVAPALLLLIVHAAETLERNVLERLTTWTLVLMVATPGVSTFVGGRVPLPWIDLV